MTAFETLTAQVAATISVEKSTVVLIQGLADQIRQNANDPAALFALANQLKDSQAVVTAAVLANPVPPTPPAVVVVAPTDPAIPPVVPPTT